MISSYGYETEVVTFRKEHKLQAYDNKAIGDKGRILPNEVSCHTQKNLVVFEHWWARYVERVVGSRKEKRILVWKPTGKHTDKQHEGNFWAWKVTITSSWPCLTFSWTRRFCCQFELRTSNYKTLRVFCLAYGMVFKGFPMQHWLTVNWNELSENHSTISLTCTVTLGVVTVVVLHVLEVTALELAAAAAAACTIMFWFACACAKLPSWATDASCTCWICPDGAIIWATCCVGSYKQLQLIQLLAEDMRKK